MKNNLEFGRCCPGNPVYKLSSVVLISYTKIKALLFSNLRNSRSIVVPEICRAIEVCGI